MNVETLLRQYAYRRGSFVLSSGKAASEYLDVKAALLHPDARRIILAGVRNWLSTLPPAPNLFNVFAGVELGGALLAVAASEWFGIPCLVVRKGERAHGTAAGIEGLGNLPEGPVNVWLAEDVVTTGQSTLEAIARLRAVPRLRLAGVLAVVDREEGGLARVHEAAGEGVPVVALTTLARVRGAAP